MADYESFVKRLTNKMHYSIVIDERREYAIIEPQRKSADPQLMATIFRGLCFICELGPKGTGDCSLKGLKSRLQLHKRSGSEIKFNPKTKRFHRCALNKNGKPLLYIQRSLCYDNARRIK